MFPSKYDNVILVGNFNTGIDDKIMKAFFLTRITKEISSNNQQALNPVKPIDLIFANKSRYFQATCAIEKDYQIFIKWLCLS